MADEAMDRRDLCAMITQLRFHKGYALCEMMLEIVSASEMLPATEAGGRLADDECAAVDHLMKMAESSTDPRLSAACVYVLQKLVASGDAEFLVRELARVVSAIKANGSYLWQLIQVLHERRLLVRESDEYIPLRSGVGELDSHLTQADAVLANRHIFIPW